MSKRKFQSLGVLETLTDLHLPHVPYFQILVARLYIAVDYNRPFNRTTISIDGLEHLESDEPFMVAMNHTDRFNYIPFMKEMDRLGLPPLAPWVKGKYYQNPWLARLLSWNACIPIPSRGFLLTLDWLHRMGRKPDNEEYRLLRILGDGEWKGEEFEGEVEQYLRQAPGGGPEGFFPEFQAHFEGLSGHVVRINREAMERGYRPLVFPQGTRSKRMTKGFSGIVQMAIHTGVKILPVGVVGSELCYPGDLPISKGGHIHYVVGELFDPGKDAPKDFVPLTIRASQEHGEKFEALTQELMNRINDLLPSDYQYAVAEDGEEKGAERFV